MVTSGSSFTPTPLGRENNIEVGQTPQAPAFQWYWVRTHDMPVMIRYLNRWATAAPHKNGTNSIRICSSLF
ncbi:hypothetical protein TNCV_2484551 [Trichonephila clavipes]|uniref:Uncharacterized protein n=1 Tax=Trichonephila clavipes TaxID=2585209 RepID=A0A8X7BAU0_TRICX|nr:hypothetical protein TNCV_2484551 [Trichonephila clavipes]